MALTMEHFERVLGMVPWKAVRRARAMEVLTRIEGLGRHPKVVEVGVELGLFSEQIMAVHPSVHVTMVDSWVPKHKQPSAYRETGDPSANKTKPQQTKRRDQAEAVCHAFKHRCTILHMDSLVAALKVPNHSVDLVFLDGDHSFRGVEADIAMWKGTVVPGGWIGGHDYDNFSTQIDFTGVKRAVDDAFPDGVELGYDYTWWRQL